jgi:RAB protein geranylgeranyltransferase component A
MMLESMGECVTPLITVNNKPCNEQFNSQVLNLLNQVEGCFEKIVQTSKLELDRSNEQLMRAVDSLASKERDIQRAN